METGRDSSVKKCKITLKNIRKQYFIMRDFEIRNLWQRSIFLSAFLILFFSGYGYIVSKILDSNNNKFLLNNIACVIILFGLIYSIIWVMMAKGSKAWYEVYEAKIDDLDKELGVPEKHRMGNCNIRDLDDNIFFSNKAGKYSVSQLNIIIGRVMMIFWILAFMIHCGLGFYNFHQKICSKNLDYVFSLSLIIFYIISFVIILCTANSNSWAKSNALKKQ